MANNNLEGQSSRNPAGSQLNSQFPVSMNNNSDQTLLHSFITPASPNPNPNLIGNADSNHTENVTLNIPPTFPNHHNTLVNIGTSVPNEANAANVAPATRRGRPLGSRNRSKVQVYPNEDLSTPLVVLGFPPNYEIISWLLGYAQRRNISLAVVGGFGSVSKVVFKPLGSQHLNREYSNRIMALMSISGTYVFSPIQPSPSQSFFNATVAMENLEVVSGGALKIFTAGHVVLKISLYSRNPFIQL